MKAHPASRLSMALCLCVWVNAQAASAQIALDAVWRDEATGGLAWRRFDASGKTLEYAVSPYPPLVHGAAPPAALEQKVPLGSLWKLFVYLWLVETKADAPPYVNTGMKALREEESYCGELGDSIDRDAALVSSCGLFFDPARLRIPPQTWRAFWQPRLASGAAPWLSDLAAMRPATEVTPAALILALEAAPPRAREEAASILLARAFLRGSSAYPADAWVRQVGGGWRVKTFSWFRPGSDSRFGGGAGWLADGTPVWFGGNGTGQGVMARFAAPLAAALPAPSVSLAPGCVNVRLFARYPLARVERPGGQPAQPGNLRGNHVARFTSGVSLPFRANGEIRLTMDKDQAQDQPRLDARLGLDDYVARVLDREADARETEAARALSVVIRSYLLNEARQEGNCLAIDDSSRKQRVSPNPPSAAARAVAGFTTGLTLAGSPVGYHWVTPAKNRMSWAEAVLAARAGKSWTDLLARNFPEAELRAMRDPAGLDCQSFAAAERWLAGHAPRWQRILRERLPGFETPEPPRVCLLQRGNPFSEQDRNRIHIRALKTLDDRVTLAHEYLHLGLHHPAGRDEALVERWARELAGGLYE